MATAIRPTPEVVASHENSSKVVWVLAWPAVALNSLQVVNTLLDRGFIGHLEKSALTAHGGSTSVMFMLFSLAVSVATGGTALVSRAFGAKDQYEYRHAATQALRLAFICGLVLAVLSILLAPMVSAGILPSSDTAAIKSMTAFVVVYCTALPAMFVIQVLAGCLRGIGDTRSPMVISGIQIFLHMSLNFIFIFPRHGWIPGANLGLTGAALALSISTTCSAIGYVIWVRWTPLGNVWAFKLPHKEWAYRILKIAVPAATMACLRVLSTTAFTLVLSLVANGSDAIAAMTTAFAIESIMFMPAFGLSAAAGALVGQSLGMKKPERAERLAWTAANYGALVTAALSLPIYVLSVPIASLLLGGRTEIMNPAIMLIRYLCLTEVGFGYAMVLFGAMQGAGDTKAPFWISVFSLWLFRVPLAVFLALPSHQPLFNLGVAITLPVGVGLGAQGAWVAMASTQGIQGVFSFFAFKTGRWKLKKV